MPSQQQNRLHAWKTHDADLFRECSSIFALPPIYNAGFVLKPSKAQIQLILTDDIKDIFSDFRKLHQEDIDQLLS